MLLVLEERGEADDARAAGDGGDDGRGHAALVERLAVELRGARGFGGRARAEAVASTASRSVEGPTSGPILDASGSTQRSASKMSSPARRLKAGARPSVDGRGRVAVPPPIARLPAGAARAVTSRSAAMEDIGIGAAGC